MAAVANARTMASHQDTRRHHVVPDMGLPVADSMAHVDAIPAPSASHPMAHGFQAHAPAASPRSKHSALRVAPQSGHGAPVADRNPHLGKSLAAMHTQTTASTQSARSKRVRPESRSTAYASSEASI